MQSSSRCAGNPGTPGFFGAMDVAGARSSRVKPRATSDPSMAAPDHPKRKPPLPDGLDGRRGRAGRYVLGSQPCPSCGPAQHRVGASCFSSSCCRSGPSSRVAGHRPPPPPPDPGDDRQRRKVKPFAVPMGFLAVPMQKEGFDQRLGSPRTRPRTLEACSSSKGRGAAMQGQSAMRFSWMSWRSGARIFFALTPAPGCERPADHGLRQNRPPPRDQHKPGSEGLAVEG